jgi:hypothetical protein
MGGHGPADLTLSNLVKPVFDRSVITCGSRHGCGGWKLRGAEKLWPASWEPHIHATVSRALFFTLSTAYLRAARYFLAKWAAG